MFGRLPACVRAGVHESTFPPLSLLKEAQGREEVQAVEVIVDAELQQIVLRDEEEVLKDIETLSYMFVALNSLAHTVFKNKTSS